ncbi:hypothetical protein PISMIDRAFT_15106 [Pisolithus microcarpus 441]|uniref:Uncharacterized protein n=1 Tax=Pisolithus microcarpus 441 TaxID=765257 RepID=A0A0C9YTT2_9AGAM|nr:hypothetical protein PISMIDRAFT_15106 [Pisolithus microcarpus 441]
MDSLQRSQQQLEKAAARGNKGDKDLPTSGGSAPIEAAATSLEESATQRSGGGMEAPTLSMQAETEACECDPLFLSSSWPNTPVPPHHVSPPPIPENDSPFDNSAVFGPPVSGILEDEANPVKPQPDMEEIDLTMLHGLPLPEEDVPRAWKGKCRADSSDQSPFEELDARITAIKESVKWGEETLLELHSQMAQVTTDVGQVSNALRRAKLQLQLLKKW